MKCRHQDYTPWKILLGICFTSRARSESTRKAVLLADTATQLSNQDVSNCPFKVVEWTRNMSNSTHAARRAPER